jgi:hypothetical protein
MPCNCDHMKPSLHEQESRKLMELLAEIGMHKGEVPYYGEVSAIHEHTAMLCKFCQNNDATKYSLELQIWWRDHQKADKERLEREIQEKKDGQEREAALAKLTDYERELLGL